MDTIRAIVKDELGKYAGEGENCWLFPAFDDVNGVYALIGMDYPRHQSDVPNLAYFVRVVDEKIVIEGDATYNPLYDDLVARGIPREQIVLAYQGELI